MAAGDLYQLTVIQTQDGVNGVNVFYYEQTGTPITGSDEEALRDAFNDDIIPAWQGIVTDNLTFSGYRIQKWLPKDMFPTIFNLTGITGTVASEPLPSNKAALVSFQSGDHSRRGRGRKYLMGLPVAFQDGGQFITPFWGNLQLFGELLATAIAPSAGGVSFAPHIYSSLNNSSVRVERSYMRAAIRQQRSRQEVQL